MEIVLVRYIFIYWVEIVLVRNIYFYKMEIVLIKIYIYLLDRNSFS